MVTVIYLDDSPLTKSESVTVTNEEAEATTRAIDILRMRVLSEPRWDGDIDTPYVVEVYYASILVGARVILVQHHDA